MALNVRRPRVWVPALIALALVAVVAYRVIQASAPAEAVPTVEEIRAEQGVPVTVAAVERGPLAVWRDFSGTVSGAREAVVRARTEDAVSAVTVQVGQRVARGQVLVRQAGEGVEARLRQAEAAQRQASRAVDRLRPLHEAGAISDQEWEDALTRLELAEADLSAARDALALTSPLDGTVTEVIARQGMIPSSGDALVRVADLSRLVVYLRVSAGEAAEIREGQRARVASRPGAVTGAETNATADSGEGVRTDADGTVRRVALQADPATRLVEIEVAFPPDARLIPGTLATVQIEVASIVDALSVPLGAVRDGRVWVVGADGAVSARNVQVGAQTRERTQILSGIEAGERVVVEGGALLSEGARVRIVEGSGE